jgi:CRISPR-associated protein Cas2
VEVIYLVAYDIADDQRRETVAATLASCGARVQFSVFECEVPDATAVAQLKDRVGNLIDIDEDQVRFYPLPVPTVRDLDILGNRRLEERQDYWII